MNARTLIATSLVLLGVIALVSGCGNDTVVSTTTTEAPILPPQNVVVTQAPSGAVFLSWDANTQSILQGYNVYRRDTAAGEILTLTAKPTRDNRFVDTQVDWQKEYEYRVTTVSTRGGESGFVASIIELHEPNTSNRKTRPRG